MVVLGHLLSVVTEVEVLISFRPPRLIGPEQLCAHVGRREHVKVLANFGASPEPRALQSKQSAHLRKRCARALGQTLDCALASRDVFVIVGNRTHVNLSVECEVVQGSQRSRNSMSLYSESADREGKVSPHDSRNRFLSHGGTTSFCRASPAHRKREAATWHGPGRPCHESVSAGGPQYAYANYVSRYEKAAARLAVVAGGNSRSRGD